ncbi:chorismate mutase [candidate division GN15 bacterium]|uniref:chorismate mutase n=1 Tax=candidate division GN15 bacterium TaxID=2072418 RepID=A0A855WYU0_9BACT|nr:MAG: chorismate mutase [candidate division GN15 bacterium]
MRVRGIRGAIDVPENTREAVFEATIKLVQEMLSRNAVDTAEIASIFLTATVDLNADFPAYAARQIGLSTVPLLCAQEIDVPGSMKRLIRVLIHVNTEKTQSEIAHCYLGETAKLRPDIGDRP